MPPVYRKIETDEYNILADRILYEDNHIIVFNKRSGEIVQGDKSGDEPLAETLKAYIAQRDGKPGRVFMGVPHRLDRPVSGAIVFAKTSKALERLNEMLRKGLVHKTYWALVCSCPKCLNAAAVAKDADRFAASASSAAAADGWVEAVDYLRRNEAQNKTYVLRGGSRPHKIPEGYKEARLRLRLLAPTQRYYLVEVELLTGRHHQIRAQLAAMGSPIRGDLKYGAPRSNRDGSISLHARKIEFVHPVSGKEICVEAPLDSVAFPGI